MYRGEKGDYKMNIKTALIKLDGLFDCLSECGVLSDEEYDLMNEVEDTIVAYVKEKERN